MKALIIDTTSSTLFVGIIANDVTDYIKISNKQFHNSIVLNTIEELLLKHNLETLDMDYIAAVTGPGSYTGIRIGVSIANAIAYAHKNIKRIELNALSLIAPDNYGEYIAAIPARADNYYYALINNNKIIDQGDADISFIMSYSSYFIRENDEIAPSNYFKAFYNSIDKVEKMLVPRYYKKSQAERLKDRK